MQLQKNPLDITNSQLAQVQAQQRLLIQIFNDKYKHLEHRKQFYTNIYTATRFCIARDFKKEKVVQMWVKWVDWYESYQPDKINEQDQIIKKIHTSGKYRFAGNDKAGCPVLIIQMKYHVKGLATAPENLKYLLYMIEKGVKLAQKAGTHQLAVIFDRRDMAESDEVSKESMKSFMPMLNDYYPQLLRAFYVFGANTFYRAMWKIATIFISKRTEQKINLLEDPDKITEYVTLENLPTVYGGQVTLQ